MRVNRRASRGQVIVIFGVSAVAIFAVVSLAIDGGRVLMDQRSLQNLADGAALTAGADIGPGADATTSGTAQDDAVLSIERALGISFSNNYTCPGPAWCAGGQSGVLTHRLLGGPCAPWACTPTTAGSNHGPWNASTAGISPCCTNWTDSTGGYLLNITTPFSCCGAASEREAFVQVRLTHHMPLLIGGSLWPTVDVAVFTVARNYAIPYAIFMFKHNDSLDIQSNGGTTITATKRVGDNGSNSVVGGSLTFLCAPSPAYGGDLYEWYPSATAINAASVREGSCPGPSAARALCFNGASAPCTSPSYIVPPTLHLPADPSTLGVVGCSALLTTTISTDFVILQPTQSLDPTQSGCTRYNTVNVQNNGVAYLNPGTYYFESTANGSGLSDTGYLVSGDCYPVAINFPACDPAVAVAQGVCGLAGYHCTTDRDFGVLLVFWPGGSDDNCNNLTNNGQSYCKQTNSSGSNNTLQVTGSGNIHLTSSSKYHNVAIWVDPNHAQSTWNFSNSGQLPASCNTQACSHVIGDGSHVVQIQGGGTIGINGAIFAPEDNILLGGGAAGSGYGQLLAYTLNLNGGVPINERYNPLALAYSPVIVQ